MLNFLLCRKSEDGNEDDKNILMCKQDSDDEDYDGVRKAGKKKLLKYKKSPTGLGQRRLDYKHEEDTL